jgi:hypothetical protein
MPDIQDIANDLGIDTSVEDTGNAEVENDFLGNAAVEDRIADLFGQTTSKEQPDKEKEMQAAKDESDGNQNKKPEETGDESKTGDKLKSGDKPLSFEDASKQSFIKDGELDSEKIGNYFLNRDRYSVDFSAIKDVPLESKSPELSNESPDDKYYKDVSKIVESLPDIIKDEGQKGFTPEQTLQRLINTFNGFNADRDARKGLLSEREELSKQFKSELDQVRQDKLEARIKNNTAELSSHYDNLIPGVKGSEVLNTFMLDQKYGGKMMDTLFRKENPNFDSLGEDEKKSVTTQWFKSFQGNKRDMAMVAEFGRAMWLVEQIPGIVQHAQRVGAAKDANESETQREKPSKLTQRSQGTSKLDAFFGYDTVT